MADPHIEYLLKKILTTKAVSTRAITSPVSGQVYYHPTSGGIDLQKHGVATWLILASGACAVELEFSPDNTSGSFKAIEGANIESADFATNKYNSIHTTLGAMYARVAVTPASSPGSLDISIIYRGLE